MIEPGEGLARWLLIILFLVFVVGVLIGWLVS